MDKLVLGAVLVVTATTLVAVPAAAAPARCDGRAATIVGGPNRYFLRGTPGDDVMVSNGSSAVRAGAGNDRVCVTGRAQEYVSVHTGPGDDRVLVKVDHRRMTVAAELGSGADLFRSGGTRDRVDSADSWGAPTDDDPDRIGTGANRDDVLVGGPDTPVVDRVRAGAGADFVNVRGAPGPGHRLIGGAGSDRLHVHTTSETGVHEFDNDAGRARANGETVATWGGFEDFDLYMGADRPILFVGGPRDESVESDRLEGAIMGRGDDRVWTYAMESDPLERLFSGGRGHDWLLVAGPYDGWITANLALRRVTTQHGGAVSPVIRLDSFEDLQVLGAEVTVRGDSGPNKLDGYGCSVTAVGRAGNDVLTSTGLLDYGQGCDHRVTFKGGAGADRLTGGRGPDRLLGGAGFDRALGWKGRDLCRAEVRRNCERR